MLQRLNDSFQRAFPRLARSRPFRLARRVRNALRGWRDLLFERREYRAWRAQHEPDDAELKAQRASPRAAAGARFVLVQALPGTTAGQAQAWIKRLARQTHRHWTAWLGVPPEHLPALQEFLAGLEPGGDVQLYPLPDVPDLRLQAGDYLLPLDPDMLLSPDALWQLAHFAAGHPDFDWLYTDQDLMDVSGRRAPWFKPDPSPELLWSLAYVLPAAIRITSDSARLPLAPAADGFWNTAALLECLPPDEHIGHLPRLLFHRLTSAQHLQPLAVRREAEAERHRRWVEKRLRASDDPQARVEVDKSGWPHIRWSAKDRRVSVVIASAGEPRLLGRCLAALLAESGGPALDVRVVVAAGAGEKLAALPGLRDERVTLLETPEAGFNYSRANNRGAAGAQGELLLFLNDDVVAGRPGWLAEMAAWAGRPGVGVVGAKLRYPGGAIQHYSVVIGLGGHAAHPFQGERDVLYGIFGSTYWYRDVSAVTGACLMIRRELFETLGGFDEGYQLVYSDIDLCLRTLEHGQRVMVTPFAELTHEEGRSRGAAMPPADMQRALDSFLPVIRRGDPYFNPNLSYLSARPCLPSGEEDRVARVRKVTARAMRS